MPKPKPLISVIVPIYKIERYLGLCIESIINQDYDNLEIILVDDGSPDRCPEICDLYQNKDSRIVVIHKENSGLVSARKAGLRQAHGEYVGYVDGDDWIDNDFYRSLLVAAVDADADIAIAGQERNLFGKREKLNNGIPAGVYEGQALDDIRSKMLSMNPFYNLGIFTYVWNKLFKREVLYKAQINVDDEIFIGEDAACTYPAILASKRICIVENCSYHYRQREDSMLKKNAPFKEEAPYIRRLHDCMVRALTKSEERYNLRQQISDYILSVFLIRSGGLLPTDSELSKAFPFGVDIYNKRIAIYSAGTFGQQLKARLLEAEHCSIAGWYDDDFWEYRRCGLDVDPVEEILHADFEYILIATVNTGLADAIKKRLITLGLDGMKILTINCPCEVRAEALQVYLQSG